MNTNLKTFTELKLILKYILYNIAVTRLFTAQINSVKTYNGIVVCKELRCRSIKLVGIFVFSIELALNASMLVANL
ncbi:MAG: hypothetical protein H7331_09250 [Bacteroidia bacterium]|nr:hypothetical protein [Bacteroidia bacterium]